MVTFRVSGEEYETLTKACMSSGARSIADFARAAALQKAQMPEVSAGTLSGDLTTLSHALGELDESLSEIHRRIRLVLGPRRQGEGRPRTADRRDGELTGESMKWQND